MKRFCTDVDTLDMPVGMQLSEDFAPEDEERDDEEEWDEDEEWDDDGRFDAWA